MGYLLGSHGRHTLAVTKGHGQSRSQKDKERAAYLKHHGVERTTGRCALCYRIIAVDSAKSRYSHKCG
jgi:hypothetical protein